MFTQKQKFVLEQALISTIGATVKLRQRQFYKSKTELRLSKSDYESKKKSFRNEFGVVLLRAANNLKDIHADQREAKLIEQIEWVLTGLNKIKGDLLVDEQPTFGIAQKAMNLTLKYLWCLDLMEEPPHCPVDSQVLKSVKLAGKVWSLMNKSDYESAIQEVKKAAGKKSISTWELDKWRPSITVQNN